MYWFENEKNRTTKGARQKKNEKWLHPLRKEEKGRLREKKKKGWGRLNVLVSCGIFGWVGVLKKNTKPGVEKSRTETVVGEISTMTFLFSKYLLLLKFGLDGCVGIGRASGLVLVDIPAHLDALALKAALFIKGYVLL